MKVKVYFNLHKMVFSVVALEGENYGRVIAHKETIALKNPVFKVSEAGRQRVLREQKKNVHAYVVGEWVEFPQPESGLTPVTYNPYKFDSFMKVLPNAMEPIKQAKLAFLENKKIMALV
jgi:hypothetical protein